MIHFIRGIIAAFAGLLLVCVIIVAGAEKMTLGQATYFVLVTALTIGYGDITPVTTWGRVAAVAAGILGLLVTGIVIAVAVRALGQAVQEDLRERDAEG